MNKNKFLLLFTIFFLVFNGTLFADENNPTPDELEWLSDLDEPTEEVDKTLQSKFVIIEAVGAHELNPHLTAMAGDAQFLTGLYEGLFSYNPITLDPQYAIAVNYNISRDKKRWIFTINPKAYFSNGEKITAHHVKDSWMKLLSTKNAPYASMLDVIEGAKKFREGKTLAENVGIYVLSDSELMIHLVKPANYLPKILCHPAFSIVHKQSDVYSGPFVLSEQTQNSYVLTKNQKYWDKENTNLESIIFIQSDDEDENAFAFNTGLADWITGPVNQQKILGKNTGMINAEFATSYFFFNLRNTKTKISPWTVQDFRKSLFEAFPWDEFRNGFFVPATTFVYPLSGYPQVEGFNFTDLIEAQKNIDFARKKHGDFFGVQDKNKKIPITLEITKNSFSLERLAILKAAWSKIGVELQVRELSPSQYYSNINKSDADIFCYTWIGDFADPLAFLDLFRSDSSLNDSGYSNKKFDELLDLAAKSSGEESYAYLAKAETILLDSYVIIPLQHPVTLNIINLETVGGWATNAFDIHPLKYIFKKQEKQKLPNVVLK